MRRLATCFRIASISLRAQVGQQRPVAPHQVIGDGHQLAVHLLRRLVDSDGIVERLRHFLHAIETFDDGHHQDNLRRLAGLALQFAAHEKIEFLIGAAQFHIRFQRDGIVALRQRIQHFVQRDGLFGLKALVKVVAFQHLRDGEFGSQTDDAFKAKLVQPFGIEADFGLCLDREF